ncbi:MAG: flippase [Oligoflexia bacterium]|nr:flippase [Oligoflexia bacterium]
MFKTALLLKKFFNPILNPNRLAMFYNTVWLLLEKVFRIGLGFFVTALVARYLRPEQFGILSYAVSVIALMEPLVNLGLNSVLKKYLLYHQEQSAEILGTVLLLRSISALTSVVVIYILVPIINTSVLADGNNLSTKILLYILSIGLIFKIFEIVDIIFETQVNSKYPSIVKSLSIVFSSVIKLFLIYHDYSLIYFGYAIIGEGLFCAIGCLYVLRYRQTAFPPIFDWRVDRKILRKILGEGAPMILVGVAVMIYMKIDQVMLKHMVDARAVGIYSVAVKLSEPWAMVASNIIASIFPTMVLAKKRSLSDYYRKLQKLFAFMNALAVVVILPTAIFSEFLVTLIFGSEYLPAAPILRVHIFANFFIFIALAQDPWDIVEKHMKFVLLKTLFAAISNVLLNLWLIPRYQGMGAAWATLIAYSSIFYLNIFHRKCRKAMLLEIKALFFWKYLR